MRDQTGYREQETVVYGVVRFTPGGHRQVLDIVITFASAAAADGFATERGWADYEVAPARFFVHEWQLSTATLPPPPARGPIGPPAPAPPARPAPPERRPPAGGPALPKQGHRPAPADLAGPPGLAGAGSANDLTATVTARDQDHWAITLGAGSDPADAMRALARLPAGLALAVIPGEGETVLTYDPAPGSPPTPRPTTVGEGLLARYAAPDPDARWMTTGEQNAYRAGRAAALADVRRALM
ncbi:hypothetical protein [Frankia sp. AgB32]|uniref:hypothetical protein n=1 Tax=Frankia sp. AgB32 TaxID=631119 RepID=UPI0020107A93|nr:hypothetical protein [Frankia sp. AgB32]MCK9896168.1 hypothetical protein [Frankia sp. AgB32]